jgi:hypothetical protein
MHAIQVGLLRNIRVAESYISRNISNNTGQSANTSAQSVAHLTVPPRLSHGAPPDSQGKQV